MPDIFDQINPQPLAGKKPTPSKGLKFNDSSAAGQPQGSSDEEQSAPPPIGPTEKGDIFSQINPGKDIFDQLNPSGTSDEYYRQLYRQQSQQGLGDVLKGYGKGVVGLKNLATGTAGELGTTFGEAEAGAEQNPLGLPTSEPARKLRATLLEGAATTGRNYLNMATQDMPTPQEQLAAGGNFVGAMFNHLANKPGGLVRNLLKKTGVITQTPEEEEAEYQQWKRNQQDKEELEKTPAAPAALQQIWSGGAQPLPNTTAAVSMALDPLNYLAPGEGAAGQALRKVQAGVQVASAAERAAAMTGKVLKTGGKILEKTGELPETLAEKLTEGALGPQASEAASKFISGAKVASVPLAAIHGGTPEVVGAALEGAKRVGKAAEAAGEVTQAAAEADRNNPFGRLNAMASDPNLAGNREWIRYSASSPFVKAATAAGGAVKDVAAGALHGGAMGAALGTANADTPEELGENIGQMSAIGAGGRALTLESQAKARVMQKMANAAAELYANHVKDGISPDTLKKIDDPTMMTAAAAQKMFKDVRIRFLDGENGQFADQANKSQASPNSAGFWSPTDRTIYLNADSGRGANTTLLHELMHPLFDSVVANRPELKAKIDSSLQKSGKTLDQAKRDYAEQAVGDRGKFTDPNDYDRAVNQFIDRMDKGSAALHNDPNHWAYSELMAEAGMKAMSGKNIVTDIIDPNLSSRIAQAGKGLLEGLGVKFKENEGGKTIFPNFEDTITSPELRKSTYNMMRAMKDYRPGIDEPVEQGVKVTPDTAGQHPAAPVHVLPNGELGNDFMVESPSGSGKFVQRPNKDIRKAGQNRRDEVNAAYPLPQTEAPTTSDPKLQWRKTPSGNSERSGTTLGPDFDRLRTFSDDSKAKAHQIEEAIKNGTALQGWNQQIGTGPDWRGSVSRDTGAVTAQHKQFMPINFHADKQGNILVRNYSLGAFNDKAQTWANRHGDLSFDLWDGNVKEFKDDVAKYLDNHKNGLAGDTGIGEKKKNAINAFLVGKNVTWETANPLRAKMRGSDAQGVVRSYRLDRLETLAPHETELSQPDYAKQVKNLSPDIEVVGPDGKKYKATYDGDQDFTAIGGKKFPQITLKDEVPGFTKNSTTYGPSLEAKGYKFEIPKNETINPPGLDSHEVNMSPDIKDPRAIKAAAIQEPETGQQYEGPMHLFAQKAAMENGHTLRELLNWHEGFVDNAGNFLNRRQAYERAQETGQLRQEPGTDAGTGRPQRAEDLEAAKKASSKFGLVSEAVNMSPDVPRTMPEDKELSRYAKRIVNLTNSKGGSSFDVTTGKAATRGFGTSLYPDRTELVEKGQLTPEAVQAFARKNADLLAQPEHVVGTWHDKDSGKTYLDVSYVAPNENIAKHAAEMFNQKAYYDIKGKKEVATGGTGEPMENMPPALERAAQAKASFAKTQELPQGEVRGPVQVALPQGTDKSKGRVRTVQEAQHLDLNAIKDAPDTENYRKKLVEQFRTQPGFRDIDPTDTNKAIDEINTRVQQNLQFLYDRATPENKALWRQWYDFAHDMSHRWGKEYGLHGDVVAAINARLSPQMEWNNNVTLTRRALDTIKKDPSVTEADKEFLKAKIMKPDTEEEPQTQQSKNLMNRQLEALAGMKVGDKMSELNDLQAGMLMRSHNELYAPRSPLHDHNLQRIPGDYLKWSKPFQDLVDVVSIYRNPSFENVSDLLGGNHKVRSFYNNHVDPSSPLWTTIDTHATAASNLYPYGGSDKAVVSNFGNPNHKNSGVNGVYPVYQDAYEKVAQKNGILPRELQSIVWEQMRKELNPAAKRMVQDAVKKAAEKGGGATGPFEAIWAKAEKGEITREDAQKQIVAEFEKWNAKANHGAAAKKRAAAEAAAEDETPVASEEIERMRKEFEAAKKRGNGPLPQRAPLPPEEPRPVPMSFPRRQKLPEQPF